MREQSQFLDELVEQLRRPKQDLKLIAAQVGVSYAYLNQIKNRMKTNPGAALVEKLCNLYGISRLGMAPTLHQAHSVPLELRIKNSDEIGPGQRDAMIKILKKDYTGALQTLARLIETEGIKR